MRDALEIAEEILGRRTGEKICSSPLQTATLETMGLVDSYWPQAHSNPEMMARLSSAAYECAGIQSLRIPFDICVEAEAMGCEVRMGRADTPPSVMNPAFTEFDELKIPSSVQDRGRIPTILKATKLLKERYGNSTPIYTMLVGPITLLGFLVGIEKTLYALSTQPHVLRNALDAVVQFNIDYANALSDEGNRFVLIADPVASGDLLAGEHFVTHILPCYQRIRRHVRARTILHICGNTNPLLRHLPETGFEAFSFHGPEVEVRDARRMVGDKMALVGNLPSGTLLRYSNPSLIRSRSIKALQEGIDMLAPACGFHPLTPLANMKAMVGAVEKFASRVDHPR
jgi:[methyl-Co(III) methanol-specific corrinoid protein]:coenzyme M methyltransferase